MINVPQGYKLIHDGPATLVVKKEYEKSLLKLGIAKPQLLLNKYYSADSRSKGRGVVPAIPITKTPDTKIMLRKYLRGGLIRFINKDLFLNSHRPLDELNIGTEAFRKGIPTAETLAAVSIKVSGFFYENYLITKELASCCDLPQYLERLSKSLKNNFLEKKEQVLLKTAEAVKTMHDNGFLHADLNMKNILVHSLNPEKLYIIDWDKSVLQDKLSDSERSSNIIRFCRSMAKLKQGGIPVTEHDRELFLNSYWKDPEKALIDLEKLNRTVTRRKVIWKILKK